MTKTVTGKSLYLCGYNLASAFGWSLVLHACVTGYLRGNTPKQLWEGVGDMLCLVQTAAALEMAHSLLRLTRSPFMATFMQVMSRLFLVHVVTLRSAEAQAHWSLYLMVTSWALVEIPRYCFYACALFLESKDIPGPLFALRYSLFMVLYPTGITGEMLQMLVGAAALSSGTAHGFHFDMPAMLAAVGLGSAQAAAESGAASLAVVSAAFSYRLVSFTWIGYLAGGPYMWMNMYGMRKRAYRNRSRALNKRPPCGVEWPITDKKTGARSTLKTNKEIWIEAFIGFTEAGYEVQERSKLIGKLRNCKNWRRDYHKWVNTSVQISCESAGDCLAVAKAGLEAAGRLFTYVHPENKSVRSLEDAVQLERMATECSYFTVVREGSQRKAYVRACNNASSVPGFNYGGGITIPYKGQSGAPYFNYEGQQDSNLLAGDELKAQLDQWVSYGTMERDAADAIKRCIDDPQHYCDLTEEVFVILGATSAMGPIEVLLRHGATVVAVDLDRSGTWMNLLNKLKNSPGRMVIPVWKSKLADGGEDASVLEEMEDKELAGVAGCNLLTQVPFIARWLKQLVSDNVIPSSGDKLTVGNYTYLDGELHVRLSVACNFLIDTLCDANENCKIAFLCTPTDCHLIPEEAWRDAQVNYENAPLWQKLLSPVLGLKRNRMEPVEAEDGTFYMVDGIVGQQGPNYALAKRMQHWMAMAQRAEGHTVASNVAPSTATISVTHNVLFKMAYGGMHLFKPMEVSIFLQPPPPRHPDTLTPSLGFFLF